MTTQATCDLCRAQLYQGGKLYLNYPKRRARIMRAGRLRHELDWKAALSARRSLEQAYGSQIVIIGVAGRHTADSEPTSLTTQQVLERWPQLKEYYSAPQQQISRAVTRGALNGVMFGPGKPGAIYIDGRFRSFLEKRGIPFDQGGGQSGRAMAA